MKQRLEVLPSILFWVLDIEFNLVLRQKKQEQQECLEGAFWDKS